MGFGCESEQTGPITDSEFKLKGGQQCPRCRKGTLMINFVDNTALCQNYKCGAVFNPKTGKLNK